MRRDLTLERRFLNAKRGRKRKSSVAAVLQANTTMEMTARSRAGWARSWVPAGGEEQNSLYIRKMIKRAV